MNKRRNVLFALTLPLSVSGAANAITLEDAIKKTLTTHPEVSASVNSRHAADYNLQAAKGGYLPSLNLSAGTGWEQSDNSTTRAADDHHRNLHRSESALTLTQNVFNGFATTSEVARQQATVNSRAWGVGNVSESNALGTVQAYLDVLMRQKFVDLAQANLTSHERIFDQINLRTQQGVGRQADYEQAEARLAQARNNLLTEQTNLEDSRTNFYSITGSEPESLVQPAAAVAPGSLESARKIMLKNSPLLKMAESDVEATRQQYEASKSSFYPTVNIDVGRTMDNNIDGTRGHSNEWQAMLRMKYNLFNGGSDKNTMTSNAYKMREAQDVKNNAQRQLTEELRLAWNALQNARQQVPIAKNYADQSYKVRDAYQKQFSIGERTLLDLLDSENEVFSAQRRFIEMQYVELFSGYRIKARTGELLKSLNIQPPSASQVEGEQGADAPQTLPELK